MKHSRSASFTRRAWLAGAAASAGAAWLSVPNARAQSLTSLDVAYAGSMGSMIEGPIKAQAAQQLHLDVHGRAQGSDALAQLIVGGTIAPDVFITVTPSPMQTVLRAGRAQVAYPLARTEMVIAYSPKSRFAPQFAAAGKRGAMPWWQLLEQPGLRFGRTDPVTDPQGRNMIFTMQLAATYYKQPALVARVLGDTINQSQIFSEPTVQARLQSGELDAASAYKIQPEPFNLPFITLPVEVNLSSDRLSAQYAQATLNLGGKTYHPEALIYYAAVLSAAPHQTQATAFVQWLQSSDGQAVFHQYFYDAATGAAALRP